MFLCGIIKSTAFLIALKMLSHPSSRSPRCGAWWRSKSSHVVEVLADPAKQRVYRIGLIADHCQSSEDRLPLKGGVVMYPGQARVILASPYNGSLIRHQLWDP